MKGRKATEKGVVGKRELHVCAKRKRELVVC